MHARTNPQENCATLHLAELPEETLLNIIHFTSRNDQANVASVNKFFCRLVNDQSTTLSLTKRLKPINERIEHLSIVESDDALRGGINFWTGLAFCTSPCWLGILAIPAALYDLITEQQPSSILGIAGIAGSIGLNILLWKKGDATKKKHCEELNQLDADKRAIKQALTHRIW